MSNLQSIKGLKSWNGRKFKFLTLNPIFTKTFKPGMILSNKEKNGKLSNAKSGHPAHVEDMSRARRSRLRVCRGVWGHAPQENLYFQHGFLDF